MAVAFGIKTERSARVGSELRGCSHRVHGGRRHLGGAPAPVVSVRRPVPRPRIDDRNLAVLEIRTTAEPDTGGRFIRSAHGERSMSINAMRSP